MGRLEQEYRKVLDGLRFSGEGKERIMKNLMEQQEGRAGKGKHFRAVRTVILAAAVCLALAGTAFAVAGSMGVTTRLVDGRVQFGRFDREPSYLVTDDGMALFPLSCFSEEVLTLPVSEGGHGKKSFDSWDAMRQFLGLELAGNPVLEGAKPGWGSGKDGHVELSADGGEQGMRLVHAFAYYRMGDALVSVMARVHTEEYEVEGSPWNYEPSEEERAQWAAYQELYGGSVMLFQVSEGDEAVEEDPYMAQCGSPVTIMRYDRQGEWPKYHGFFILDGVLYHVEVGANPVGHRPTDPSPVSGSELLETMKTVLDGFAL